MTPREFAESLDRLRSGGLRDVVLGPMVATMLDAEREGKVNASGRILNRRTGQLAQSISGTVDQSGEMPTGTLRAGGRLGGKAVRHGRMQELGGTIYPRRGKYLRIPLPPALTGAGVDRYPTPLRQSAAGVFFAAKSKAGNLLLFHRETGVPWYALKPSSTIPARPYLRPALEDAAPKLEGRILKSLRDAIATGGA